MPSGHWCPVEIFLDKEATTCNSISIVGEEHTEAFSQKNLLKTGTELRRTLQHLTFLPCPNFCEQGNINFTGQELCYILCYQPTT